MKRYRYGINQETVNVGNIPDFLPVGYVEVVPGDTVGGSVSCRLISDITVKPVYSRAYFDAYAFYCPYRLLDDGFVDFIRTNGLSGSLATVANAFTQNFEPGVEAHPAFQRRMYNTIWNQFFRTGASGAEVSVDQNTILRASYRKSTFYESFSRMLTFDQSVDVPVDTIAGSVSVEDLRAGFAEDRIRKMRGFYGAKYTDYLASLGVDVSWTILEEPEVIGMKGTDLTYRTTKSTYQASDTLAGGQAGLGSPGGQFEGHVTVPIKRTFCPEHGLIGVYVVARSERYNLNRRPPMYTKLAWDDYWSPELAYRRRDDVRGFLGLNSANQDAWVPPFEDLRKGVNLVGYVASATPETFYGNVFADNDETVEDIVGPLESAFDPLFQGTMPTHYQVFNKFRVVKQSPVRPDPRNVGVQ